jgi:antitoxin component YwqK of YwqJK toxin-antitoxin module
MKTLPFLFFTAILSMSVLQTVRSQDVSAPNPKNGYSIEKFGDLNVEGNYINGKKDGTWLTYFPTGLLNKVEQYKDGKKNGIFIEIDSKGALLNQSFYKDDQLDGSVNLTADQANSTGRKIIR